MRVMNEGDLVILALIHHLLLITFFLSPLSHHF
jgi:hypothetical protein